MRTRRQLKRTIERQKAQIADLTAQLADCERGPLMLDPALIALRPTFGAAWDYMKARAYDALSGMNLSSAPDATSPWLPNYNGARFVKRPGTQTLAAALVYARTGEQEYKDLVTNACRYLIGTEDESSLDGTATQDKLLATCRQIGAFVLAANLVGMDDRDWNAWLGALRTKPIGTSGQASNITQLSDERANNWGSFARAARIAIDIYLGDDADLELVVERFKLVLGEIDQRPDLLWIEDADFDLSYACDKPWRGINSSACGLGKDGIIVEDLSRSIRAFPNYDATGIGYTFEAYQAMLFTAVLLERQGFDAFGWGDQALRRVMDWLVRENYPHGNGYSTEQHEVWIVRHFYGVDYPTTPAQMGRCFGFTDWLYG